MRTLTLYFLTVISLFACKQEKPDISQDETQIDADGDGYYQGEDCDDSDSDVYPGMEEQCDGIDNDCDGQIDEGVEQTYFIDNDADGFGTEGFVFEACEAPSGYVPVGNDCNDSDPLSYPGAPEVCDGLDNDCDTDVDEELLITFFQDADSDSFGNPDVNLEACLAPDGYVENDDDCDDTNPNIFPGAAELSDPDACMLDADGDGFGDANPPDGVTPGDDCDDSDSGIHPEATEICDGIDNDCDGLIDDEDPDVDFSFGLSTLYPDNDGDGFGNPNADPSDILFACSEIEGHVHDNTDCDDTPITGAVIYPGAPETCDFVDNDCDTVVDAPLTVGFFATGALVASDMTAEFTGGPALPATPTITDEGTLSVCEGTYYLNMTIEADVQIQPKGTVVFDGASQGSIILIDSPGIAVNIDDLSLQNGYGSLSTSINTPNNGGGIACRGAGTSLTLDTVHFDGNSADLGGGMFMQECEANLFGVTFSNNYAEWGGGIYTETSTIIGQDVAFDGNESVEAGGGAYWSSTGDYDFSSVTWSANTSAYGGAFYGWRVNIDITDAVWSANTAETGGAIFFYDGDLNIENSTFDANAANIFGGALRLGGDETSQNTNTSFIDTELTNNTALYGGVMSISEGTHTLSNSLLEMNSASFGGALLIGEQDINTQAHLGLDLLLDATLLQSNTASLGGAAYVRFGAQLNCDGTNSIAGFEQNSEPPQGGTGAVHLVTSGTLNTQQCTFGSGSQDNSPADVYLEQGSTQVTENFGTSVSVSCSGLSCN